MDKRTDCSEINTIGRITRLMIKLKVNLKDKFYKSKKRFSQFGRKSIHDFEKQNLCLKE
ncbi:hypothetical protein [Acetobacterium sp.]|uniref:hypothetical protein n=1 Tax=Acetobacterium sp. TaxID=1872094 RepID=UPI002F40F4F9